MMTIKLNSDCDAIENFEEWRANTCWWLRPSRKLFIVSCTSQPATGGNNHRSCSGFFMSFMLDQQADECSPVRSAHKVDTNFIMWIWTQPSSEICSTKVATKAQLDFWSAAQQVVQTDTCVNATSTLLMSRLKRIRSVKLIAHLGEFISHRAGPELVCVCILLCIILNNAKIWQQPDSNMTARLLRKQLKLSLSYYIIIIVG